MNRILILEDELLLSKRYKRILEKEGYDVLTTKNSAEFFDNYSDYQPDLIMLDIHLKDSKLNGIEVYKKLNEDPKFCSKVIILSGEASRNQVANAMKMGAFTFIEKSEKFNLEKFLADVLQAMNLHKQEFYNKKLLDSNKHIKERLINTSFPFIGECPEILKIKKLITRFAQFNIDVLIEGETGTGKEIVATNLYWQSQRAGEEFICINASSIQDSLEISELFGHTKGSFTSADSDKKGFFEKANKGVLFLDEIAELKLSTQAKILRTLENREIHILGGDTKKIDVRLIFASNHDLKSMIREGKFRKDLYFRLSANKITLPPLRERGEDVIILTKYFFNKGNSMSNINIDYSKIRNRLMDYNWPGNVRELKGFCDNVLIKYDNIDAEIIKLELDKQDNNVLSKNDEFDELGYLMELDNFDNAHRDFQKMYILEHLRRNKYKVNVTGSKIGIERTRLYRLMKKFNINKNEI